MESPISFEQKRLVGYRRFNLTSDKITVETRNWSKTDKYEIKLDRLGLDIHYQSDNTIAGMIFFGFCIALLVAITVVHLWVEPMDLGILIFNYGLWSFLAMFAYLKPHADDIYLVGGQTNLVFYRNIPNEQAVLSFIEQIRTSIKAYLKKKYTVFDDTTIEQDFYARIAWLRDREVITNNEYSELKHSFDTQKLL